MLKRYITSTIGALAITFLLFWGMDYLIAPGLIEKPKIKKHPPIKIGKVKEAADIIDKINKPEPPENAPLPPIDDFPETDRNDDGPVVIGLNNPPPPSGHDPGGFTRFALPEGDIQAITKFAPRYPRRPLTQGIEGYVIVKFTVNKMGAVENAVVVESSYNGFNKAAIRAVMGFKYKPRVTNGVAVAAPGIMEKISFAIEKS